MPRGKNTKEYQTVKESYPNLSDAIANVIEWACGRLLAKGLITDDQRAAASNGFVNAKNRASTVTSLLLNKVEQDTKYFQMLVDVLKQDMDTFGIVLEQMGVTGTVADATTVTSSKKAEMRRIEIASGSLKANLIGTREDYSYDVPEGVVHVSISKEDKSGGVSIGSGTGNVTLKWDKAAKKAYVHAWVNGSFGSNHVTWTVYGWI